MKNKIIILFVTLILLNIVINVNASEIIFNIDGKGNFKMDSSSSDMENLGKAISFSMSSNTQATSEDLKSIDNLIPGTTKSLGLNQETSGTKLVDAKKSIKNYIYNTANYQFKSSLDSIEKLGNYAKGNFNGGIIKINDNVITLQRSDSSEYVKIPVGYSIDYDEKSRTSFSLKADKYQDPKDSVSIGGSLGYKVKLEKGSEFKVSPDSYGNTKVELKGSGDVSIPSSSLKNIKDAVINMNKNGDIDYAQFTANEKNDYKLTYGGKRYEFSVVKDGKVLFDPKGGEINGEKASLVIGNDLKEFKVETKISSDKWSVLLENDRFKSVSLKGQGEFMDSHNVLVELKPITDKEVNIFFDGKQYEGNYISFGEKELLAKTNEGYVGLEFKSNNPYTKIEKGDYTSVRIYENSELSIKNREDQGLIAEAIVKGNFMIYNDQKEVYNNQGKDIFIQRTNGVTITSLLGHEVEKSISEYFSNSPMELSLLKSDGTPYMGDFKYQGKFTGSEQKSIDGNKIFFDNSYRLAIAPLQAESVVASYEGVNSEFSSRIGYNYPTPGNIAYLTGASITFPKDIPEGNREAVLVLLRDYYQSGISGSMQNSIKNIVFYNQKDYQDRSGFFRSGTSDIYFAWENFNAGTFSHESAHALHDKIRNSGSVMLLDNSPVSYKNPLDNNWIDGNSGKPFMQGFSSDNIDGSIKKYGMYLYREDSGISEEEFNLLSDDEKLSLLYPPKYGFTNPYGAKNRVENIATYVEKANDPEFWKPLFSKDNQWRDIYWNNFNILHNNRFITDQQFGNILKAAGIKLVGGEYVYK